MDTALQDPAHGQLIKRTHALVISPSSPGNHDGLALSSHPESPCAAAPSFPNSEVRGIDQSPCAAQECSMESRGSLELEPTPPISDECHSTFPRASVALPDLPNEVLFQVLSFLDVNDLLSASRTNHRLRHLSLAPVLHAYRLRQTRAVLPPLLESPSRPSLAELISRSIFLTDTTVVSRRLARSLVSIRLARRLAARPPAEVLVERAVLPPECVPGLTLVHVAPALVAKRRAIEKERVKDGLRRWVGAVWKGEVMQKEERVRRWEESRGVGRVWRLKKYWERVGRGDNLNAR